MSLISVKREREKTKKKSNKVRSDQKRKEGRKDQDQVQVVSCRPYLYKLFLHSFSCMLYNLSIVHLSFSLTGHH